MWGRDGAKGYDGTVYTDFVLNKKYIHVRFCYTGFTKSVLRTFEWHNKNATGNPYPVLYDWVNKALCICTILSIGICI